MTYIEKTSTRRYEVVNVSLDMFVNDAEFRRIRQGHKYQATSCFRCGHDFEDGEKMSLGIISGGAGNKMLCHACAISCKTQ